MIPPSDADASDNPSRIAHHLTAKLDRRLVAYATAATAAGVGFFAATPAEAKIVYTAANTSIPANTLVPIDLSHDGIPDFNFYFYQYGPRKLSPPLGYHQDNLVIEPLKSANEVWDVQSSKGIDFAVALPPAVKVGPGPAFKGNSALLWGSDGSAYSTVLRGKWVGLPHGAFLGLKFVINGQTHYGWAHVTVNGNGAILNGYAYETVPNQPIATGKTSGPTQTSFTNLPPLSQPASLGMLARGADALTLWRRDEENAV